jgi:hypothetical protein
MRRAVVVALMLAGCTSTGALTPQAQQIFDITCAKDAALQPIVVPVAVAVTSIAAPVAAGPAVVAGQIDQILVHPAVVAACAKYAATPVAAVPAALPAAAVAAPPVAPVAVQAKPTP